MSKQMIDKLFLNKKKIANQPTLNSALGRNFQASFSLLKAFTTSNNKKRVYYYDTPLSFFQALIH